MKLAEKEILPERINPQRYPVVLYRNFVDVEVKNSDWVSKKMEELEGSIFKTLYKCFSNFINFIFRP